MEGVLENVTALNQDLCTFIEEGQGFTLGTTTLTLDKYMTIDGQDYYGASCHRTVISSVNILPYMHLNPVTSYA